MSCVRVFALLVLGMVGPSMGGCAGDTQSADESTRGVGEPEIRASVLGSVAAMRINGGATVAAPGKMQRILINIGLAAGTPRPPEGGLRCPPSYQLEFLDTKGAVKATAGLLCGGSGAGRQNAPGSLQINGRSFLVTAKDVDALDAIAQEPPAIGDVLFGVDRVQISKPGAPETKETNDGALVAKMMRALRADQIPDPYARMARCLPTRSISFFRGTEFVGAASFSCSEAERGLVGGSFSGRDERPSGGVLVDADIVFGVESAIRQP